MVVIQAILWWKETSLAVEVGVGEFGREPSSWGPWRGVVVATETVGEGFERARRKWSWSFMVLCRWS